MLPQKKFLNLGLTGGGTAGHVWPHFALFDDANSPLSQLAAKQQLQVFYFGSVSGMEKELVLKNAPHWKYFGIQTGKLRRYFSWQNFFDPFKIFIGFIQAFKALKSHKINILFSKGGFVSAPVVWAAWLQGIPVVIHESDVTPALATKLTLPFCKLALCAFSETISLVPQQYRSRIKALGLPLRASLFSAKRADALLKFQFDSTLPTLLVFGGSLGAQSLNQKVAEILPELTKICNVLHIVGKDKSFATSDFGNRYFQTEFLGDDMKFAYAAVDLALCRAGASSIFELAAARIPMILIPLGLSQSRGDQIINAQVFEKSNWATWCAEDKLTPQILLQLVSDSLKNSSQLIQNLSNSPNSAAANQVAQQIIEIANSSH